MRSSATIRLFYRDLGARWLHDDSRWRPSKEKNGQKRVGGFLRCAPRIICPDWKGLGMQCARPAGRRAHTARPRARQPRDARRRAGWGPPGRVARASRERAAADVERSACEPASADKMHAHASVSRPRRVPTDPRARFNIKSVHTGNALNRTQSRPTAMSICTHAQTPHKDHKTQLSRHIPARPAPLVMLLSCGERTSRFGDGHHWTSRRT